MHISKYIMVVSCIAVVAMAVAGFKLSSGRAEAALAKPDLVIDRIWLQGNTCYGNTVQLWATVRNRGTAAVGQSTGVEFYLDPGAPQGCLATVPSLGVGESVSVYCNSGYYLHGNQYLFFKGVADSFGSVSELNESNNRKTTYISTSCRPSSIATY